MKTDTRRRELIHDIGVAIREVNPRAFADLLTQLEAIAPDDAQAIHDAIAFVANLPQETPA